MQITETETIILSEAAIEDRTLQLTFGENKVCLVENNDNKWAIDMLSELRKGQPAAIFVPNGT